MCTHILGEKDVILIYSFTAYLNYGSLVFPVRVPDMKETILTYGSQGSGLVHLIHEVMNFLSVKGCTLFWFCITVFGTLCVYRWALFCLPFSLWPFNSASCTNTSLYVIEN